MFSKKLNPLCRLPSLNIFLWSLILSPIAASAHDCPPESLIQADLGNQPMAFVESGPQTFFSGGLSGRIELDANGPMILANAEKRRDNAADLRIQISGGVWDWREDSDSRVQGDVTYVTPSGSVSVVPGYERVLAPDVMRGVNATAQSSGRRFELILEAESLAQLHSLQFLFSSSMSAALDGNVLQTVEPTVGSALGRQFDIELVALEEVGASFHRLRSELIAVSGGLYRPQVLGSPTGRVHLRLTVLFGPYQDAADLVRGADGQILALSSARAQGGSPRRGSLLTTFAPDAETVVQRMWIDTGDDLDLHGVAQHVDGRILLAGGRTQGSQQRSYLAAFDPESRQLETPDTADALGQGGLRGISVTDGGRVVVIGTTDPSFQDIQPANADYALALPRTDFGVQERLVVGELTPDLSGFLFAKAQPVELGPWRLETWEDCHGTLRAGVYYKKKKSGDVHHTYSFDVTPSEMATCPMYDEGWGHAILCSKWLAGGSIGTYDPSAVPASAVPTLSVELPDPGSPHPPDFQVLNDLEDNVHGPMFNPLPGGEFTGPYNHALSSTHLALAFVSYNERWGQTIAANLYVPAGSAPPTFNPILFQDAKFCAESSADLPHNLCGSLTSRQDWTYLETHVAEDCQDTNGGSFELVEIHYNLSHQGTYGSNLALDQKQVNTWFNPWEGTPFVGDPPSSDDPDETPLTALHVLEMTSWLESRALVTLDLLETQVSAGVATQTVSFEASLASRDLH